MKAKQTKIKQKREPLNKTPIDCFLYLLPKTFPTGGCQTMWPCAGTLLSSPLSLSYPSPHLSAKLIPFFYQFLTMLPVSHGSLKGGLSLRRLLPEYLQRATQWAHMDLEYALTEMSRLLVSPKGKVYSVFFRNRKCTLTSNTCTREWLCGGS
jgi:hypothetical protein